MKNYFSDSNVTAMAIDAGAIVDSPENLEAYYTLSHNELKSIMNLAVEAAIKEFNVEDLNERLAKFDKENKPRPINLDIKYDI